MAWAKLLARREGRRVANPLATNAADAAVLWAIEDRGEVFALTSGAQLVFNAVPAKLNGASILEVARDLATSELEYSMLSETLGVTARALLPLCEAVVKPSPRGLDPVWVSFILLVFLMSHEDGRALLRETPLTDVDYQTAGCAPTDPTHQS
jgi:hypothetical protein